jgi:hypothetical protein
MAVTADLVEAYLKCPTKCFLLSHEEVGAGNTLRRVDSNQDRPISLRRCPTLDDKICI